MRRSSLVKFRSSKRKHFPAPAGLAPIIPKFGWICRSIKRGIGFGRLAGLFYMSGHVARRFLRSFLR